MAEIGGETGEMRDWADCRVFQSTLKCDEKIGKAMQVAEPYDDTDLPFHLLSQLITTQLYLYTGYRGERSKKVMGWTVSGMLHASMSCFYPSISQTNRNSLAPKLLPDEQ